MFDKSLNKNAFESRYALSNDVEDKDKIKVIYVSANKATVSRITQLTEDVKASTITPIGTSITNIANVKPKENFLIVNMEDKTTVTAVVNQKVYNVDKLDEGAEEILGKISAKENSYAKAYEICKILQYIQWKERNYRMMIMNILMILCLHCIKL